MNNERRHKVTATPAGLSQSVISDDADRVRLTGILTTDNRVQLRLLQGVELKHENGFRVGESRLNAANVRISAELKHDDNGSLTGTVAPDVQVDVGYSDEGRLKTHKESSQGKTTQHTLSHNNNGWQEKDVTVDPSGQKVTSEVKTFFQRGAPNQEKVTYDGSETIADRKSKFYKRWPCE